MRTPSVLAVALLGAVACGNHQSVRPDEMSAAQHRNEADKEYATARQHLAQHDPGQTYEVVPLRPQWEERFAYPTYVYNPTDWHVEEAAKHSDHARAHEQAAAELERFEDAACNEFPPATRAACPLIGGVTRIADIPGGVEVSFADGVRMDAVYAHMRCHLAYARAQGFPAEGGCPLYMKGVSIERRGGSSVVDITIGDRARVTEVRQHAREEAVFAPIKQR